MYVFLCASFLGVFYVRLFMCVFFRRLLWRLISSINKLWVFHETFYEFMNDKNISTTDSVAWYLYFLFVCVNIFVCTICKWMCWFTIILQYYNEFILTSHFFFILYLNFISVFCMCWHVCFHSLEINVSNHYKSIRLQLMYLNVALYLYFVRVEMYVCTQCEKMWQFTKIVVNSLNV